MSANKENAPMKMAVVKLEPLDADNLTLEARLNILEKNVEILMKLGKQQDKVLKLVASELLKVGKGTTKTKAKEADVSSIKREKKKIYVCNMWPQISRNELRDHFSRFGKVTDAVVLNEFFNSSNGVVDFADKKAANAALDCDHFMSGRQVHVKKYKRRSSRGESSGNNGTSAWPSTRSTRGLRYFPY